jgi:hypothetical protein
VLDNDSDDDNDALTIDSTTDPAHGSVVNNGVDVTYTPDAGYTGGDGHGGTDTATVTVTVNSVNTGPICNGVAATTHPVKDVI